MFLLIISAVPGHIPWVASHKHTYITLQNNLRLSSGNHPWPELTTQLCLGIACDRENWPGPGSARNGASDVTTWASQCQHFGL